MMFGCWVSLSQKTTKEERIGPPAALSQGGLKGSLGRSKKTLKRGEKKTAKKCFQQRGGVQKDVRENKKRQGTNRRKKKKKERGLGEPKAKGAPKAG